MPRALRRHPVATVAGLALVVAVVVLLPLIRLTLNALAAERAADAALEALKDRDFAAAREHAADAHAQAADIQGAAHGADAALLSVVPGGDRALQDIDHFAAAMEEIASMLTLSVETYPRAAGDGTELINENREIDFDVLRELLAAVPRLDGHARAATHELDQVRAETPVLSWFVAGPRNAVQEKLEPVSEVLGAVGPAVPHIPDMLGADRPRAYLIALLNPAEQRYSGGASLSFAPLVFIDHRITKGTPLTVLNDPRAFREITWDPVVGNPFHRPGQPMRITKATFAPSWSVAGEELARAWQEVRGIYIAGVIAVDVVALEKFMTITGPIGVPGYGELNAQNLVEKLIGSYEELTTEEKFLERRRGNSVLLTSFQDKFFRAGNPAVKVERAIEAARERHLAIYFRQPDLQSMVSELGLSGELSSTPHDYVGVFNQARSGHKSDYWQKRSIRSEVELATDGSAEVTLEIEVANDSPPPATDVPEAYQNYVRRDNDMTLAAFLPTGVTEVRMVTEGSERRVKLKDFYGRPFVSTGLALAPGETRTLSFEYTVPRAAVVGEGSLDYHLDFDPAGLVQAQRLDVRVRWPDGYTVGELPDGWSSEGATARLESSEQLTSESWVLSAERR